MREVSCSRQAFDDEMTNLMRQVQVRPVNSAVSSQPDNGGGQSGFVPLDSLQRPVNWADDGEDGEDGGSLFAPQPSTSGRSAAGSAATRHQVSVGDLL